MGKKNEKKVKLTQYDYKSGALAHQVGKGVDGMVAAMQWVSQVIKRLSISASTPARHP